MRSHEWAHSAREERHDTVDYKRDGAGGAQKDAGGRDAADERRMLLVEHALLESERRNGALSLLINRLWCANMRFRPLVKTLTLLSLWPFPSPPPTRKLT